MSVFRRHRESTHTAATNFSGEKAPEILVIEPDQRYRRKLESMLDAAFATSSESSLDCVFAEGLQEGLQQYRTHRFDLILTDIKLPDASGMPVIEALLQQVRRTPVIVMSNLSDWGLVAEMVEAGVIDFLYKKTLDSDVLLRSVYFAIERRRVEQRLARTEKRLESMISMLPVGYFCLNARGIFTFANEVFAGFFDRKATWFEGRAFDEILDERAAEQFRLGLVDVLTSNRPSKFELSLADAREGDRHFGCSATPIYDAYGNVEGVQGMAHPIQAPSVARTGDACTADVTMGVERPA